MSSQTYTILKGVIVFFLLNITIENFAQSTDVHLNTTVSYPAIDFQQAKIPKQLLHSGKYYTLLQFEILPDKKQIRKLEKAGIDLLEYVPKNTYLASISTNTDLSKLSKLGLQKMAYLPAAAKQAESLNVQAKGSHEVYIFFTPDTEETEILNQFFLHGITDYQHTVKSFLWRAKLNTQQLQDLLQLPIVTWTEEVMEDFEVLNESTARHGAQYLQGYEGLTGEGVVIGVGDLGIFDHVDGRSRVTNNYSTTGNHGNNVSGIIAGAGNKDILRKGFAPKATLITDYFNNIITKTPNLFSTEGMVLTNNSYGVVNCAVLGQYNVNAYLRDDQLYDLTEVMHVYAVGNSGSPSSGCSTLPYGFGSVLSGEQSAKNIVSVGNLDINGELAYSSSKGPTRDGRIKPEICARGESIITTGGNNGYNNFGGTSAAAPAVTGGMALLVEKYRQLKGGANPKGALLKAVTCNTADDIGNPGPDYSFGFGAINLRRAVNCLEKGWFLHGAIGQGQNQSYTIQVPASTKELRVLLYWADPSAPPFSTNALINDLELTVIDNQNLRHFPLVLDPLHPEQIAQSGLDHRNNIEQVVIKNPSPGQFELAISGFSLPYGSSDFIVAYEFIDEESYLLSPNIGEVVLPLEDFTVYWEAVGNTLPFTISFSADDGATWEKVADMVSPESRSYEWSVPDIFTTRGRIKVERYNDKILLSDPFAILKRPQLRGQQYCNGAEVSLEWDAVQGANSYDLFLLREDDLEMSVFDNVKGTSYLLSLLPSDIDKEIWYAVQPVNAGGQKGLRSVGIIPTEELYEEPGHFNYFTAGLQVEFSGRVIVPSDLISNFSWNFGDGNSSTQQKPTHTYTTAGTYTVQLTVNTMCGTSIVTQMVDVSDKQTCRLQDSLQLATLYKRTDGEAWTNSWDLSAPMDTWAGVTLTTDGCNVKELNLKSVGMTGELPNLNLPSLTKLYFDNNDLTGIMPDFKFPLLEELSLVDNGLNGTIPLLSNLPLLEKLLLSKNNFRGAIPSFDFPELIYLYLQENELSGSLPPLNLPKLNRLYAMSNNLTGTLPNYSFPNIVYLLLSKNRLTGNLPAFDSMPKLNYLYLRENELTGNIHDFADCNSLKYLYLEDNNFSGNVPQITLPILERLVLEDNELSGEIPNLNLPKLAYLFLGKNKLEGNIPDISGLPNLNLLRLEENLLEGAIPNFQNPKLQEINLRGNKLSGPIPDFAATDLTTIRIHDNSFNFDGMSTATGANTYEIAPQARLPIYRMGDTLRVFAGGATSDNTYDWYKNGALVNTQQGDNSYYAASPGNYYCRIHNANISSTNYRKNLILESEEIEVGGAPTVDLMVWLQGPFLSQENRMDTRLQIDGILPGLQNTPEGQPYTGAPWNYAGTEGDLFNKEVYDRITDQTASIGIVDWVLVSFREGPTTESVLARHAALLLDDGRIHFLHDNLLPRGYTGALYVLVEHRNHMGIMSPDPIPIINNELRFDFGLQDSYKSTQSFGSILLSTSHYGMIAGDGIQAFDLPSYTVTGQDRFSWQINNGIFDTYLPGDYNLDGDINGKDKIFWDLNNGLYSVVLRSR